MKLIKIFLFIVSLSGSLTLSQWLPQVSGTTLQLRAVEVINTTTAYACGDNGAMLKTTNGGTNWVTLSTPLTGNFTSMFFFNAITGIVGSVSDDIMKTTNGGTNWQVISDGTGVTLSVVFPSANTGYIGGQNGLLRKTTNAGINWNNPGTPTSEDITALFFLNDNTGWLCTKGGVSSNVVRKTTNGGTNWTTQLTGSDMFSIVFIDASTGIIGSFAQIKRTTNGGTNWVNVTTPPVGAVNSVFMASATTGYAACGNGNILKTTDAGATWTEHFTNQTNSLRGVGFVPSNTQTGFAVGLNGKILKTTTGGGNFTPVEPIGSEIPSGYLLSQNYPNPFNPNTKISFSIPAAGFTSLRVYDLVGKEVSELVNQNLTAGSYSIDFDASSLPSGTYFYRITAGSFTETKKMILIK